jgi:large subunit ribosomal protein L9
MELILKTAVAGLGEQGAIVKVRDGYARNYLLPKGLAVPATESMKRVLLEEGRQREVRDDKIKRGMQALAEKMRGLSSTIVVQAGEEDKLYGSVSDYDIAEAVTKQGFAIDHKQVVIEEPIKKLGVYTVPIKLHRDVEVEIKVWVVKE